MNLDHRPTGELERVVDRVAVVRPCAGIDDEAFRGLAELLAPVHVLALAVRLPAVDLAAELACPFADPLLELGEREAAVHGRVPAVEGVQVHAVQDADQHGRNLVGRIGRLATNEPLAQPAVMRRRREEPAATLDDVVEFLAGIGVLFMDINAKLSYVAKLLGGDEDEETDA
jgi:hypothetical protein